MSERDRYKPGPAHGARVETDGDQWMLVLVRPLRHAPGQVWRALTDPAQLREWAPFDADRSLAAVGPVRLSTVGAPEPQVSDTEVTRADPASLLEYRWGDHTVCWRLEAEGHGTRLTLSHSLDRKLIAMVAAGWHLCLDVLDHLLAGHPLGRIVAGEAMKFEWPRLNSEYSRQLGACQGFGGRRGQDV